jgi:hypothetical protein
MALFTGIAERHKSVMANVIHSSDVQVTLRYAAPVTSAGVDPLYGDLNRETAKTGPTYGPFTCLWYDALTLSRRSQMSMFRGKGMETTIEQLAGQYREADFFAEFYLPDVLINQNDPYGLTYFDQCQWIINSGKRYKYLGAVKFSLANSAPYAMVVAVKGAVDYTD